MLDPLGLVDRLVERPQRRAATKRAKQIAETGIAGSAVADTINEINSAVMTATVAATVGATVS